MLALSVPIITKNNVESYAQEVVYSVDDFPYDDIPNLEFSRGWKRQVVENLFLTFDIESTTIIPEDPSQDPWAFMYQWQLDVCYNDQHHVIFGRRWEEFKTFRNRFYNEMIRRGCTEANVFCFVHNLPYEFVFMTAFLDPGSIMFARGKHSVLTIKEPETLIEWRCSYALTNRSLSAACENEPDCIHKKLLDTYDYRKIRTADTPLTMEEMGYCYNDVAGLSEVILGYHKRDRFIDLPLTSTGFVRRDLRRECRKEPSYHEKFQRMEFQKDHYKMMLTGFRGGDTHASRYFAGAVIPDVMCRDFASAYPSVMMQETFPSGPPVWCKIETQEQLEYYTSNYHVIMDVSFYNLKTLAPDPYISIAKTTQRINQQNDNGRLLSADFARLVITEVDLSIIREEYEYSGFKVNSAFYFLKSPLPAPIRRTLLKYYKGKTELKGVPGKEYEYNQLKALLNAIYGCAATHIHDQEWFFTGNDWEQQSKDLEEEIAKYFKSRNNVLPYQWALYVTAYVRRRLHDLIQIVGSDYFLYCDTDSVYYIKNPEVEQKIEDWNAALIERTKDLDIPCCATDPAGRVHRLGIAEVDKDLDAFKTFGAKKYMYRDKKGNHITVAGLSKKAVSFFKNDFKDFKVGTVVPAGESGRTVAYRHFDQPHYITVDGCKMLTAGGIGIVDTTYTLGITMDYNNLLSLTSVIADEEWEDFEL